MVFPNLKDILDILQNNLSGMLCLLVGLILLYFPDIEYGWIGLIFISVTVSKVINFLYEKLRSYFVFRKISKLLRTIDEKQKRELLNLRMNGPDIGVSSYWEREGRDRWKVLRSLVDKGLIHCDVNVEPMNHMKRYVFFLDKNTLFTLNALIQRGKIQSGYN